MSGNKSPKLQISKKKTEAIILKSDEIKRAPKSRREYILTGKREQRKE